MSYIDDLAPGTAMLGRAIGHAAFLYGDQPDDYDGIIHVAITGRHAAPDTTGTIYSAYVTRCARALIAEADTGLLDHDPNLAAGWIGAATAVLRELTRDA